MTGAADAVVAYVARGRAAFDADSAIRDAILYQIIVFGEAAHAALAADPRPKEARPSADWSSIARMRARMADPHWTADHGIVWAMGSEDVPALRRAITEALAQLD